MKKIISVVCFLCLIASTPIAAQPHQNISHTPRQLIKNELKLTDTQQEQFATIRYETQKKNSELHSKIALERLELQRLKSVKNFNISDIQKKLEEINTVRITIELNFLKEWSEKNKLLNDEQQKIWKHALRNKSSVGCCDNSCTNEKHHMARHKHNRQK